MEAAEHQVKILAVVETLGAELNGGTKPAVSLSSHLEWDLGMASVERTELLIRLEKELGAQLSSEQVFQAVTVADLIAIVPTAATAVSPRLIALQPGEAPPYPEHVTSLIEALDYQAAHQPERATLFFHEEGECVAQWSYGDLQSAARRVAAGLHSHGVRPGERVGIMLPTGSDYVATFFGVLWLGAIPVPLYPPLRLDQLEDYVARQGAILSLAGVRLLVSFDRAKAVLPLLKMNSKELQTVVTASELNGEAPPAHPGEMALIQFTSGSTGAPKGVTLTQQALLHNLRAYGYGMGLGQEDVTISWLPLYHDMGLIGTLLGSIYHGQPLVLMGPQDFLARPSRWLQAIHKYRGTVSPAPNFAYEICARKIPDSELEGLDLSSWRIALNGAEAVRPQTLERFTRRFAPYGFREAAHFPAYGLAEATLAVTFPPPGRGPVIDRVAREPLERDGVVVSCGAGDESLSLVACGRPLPDMEIRIVADDGVTVLGDGRRGHLQFRGPSALDSYWNNPEATRAVKDNQGWVKTGDLAYISEGELYLTGRSKDLIVIAGRNLHPEDIEDIVASVDGVRRGCVVAFGLARDADGTESLVVVAETRHHREATTKEALAKAISLAIVRQTGVAPEQIHLVPPHTVPKTPSGKIRRAETRGRLQGGRLKQPGGVVGQVAHIVSAKLRLAAGQAVQLPGRLARTVWCHSWLLGCLGLPQAVSFVSRRAGQRLLAPAARLYLKVSGVTVREVNGLEYDGPCVLVANHCSSLDPVVVAALVSRPVHFLVAPWIAEHPVLRHLISRLGHLPVQRGNAEAARAQHDEIATIVREQSYLAAFPEGGIEITPGLRPFALGVFQVAASAGVPVIPVALKGTREVQPWPRTEPYRGEVCVTFGTPLYAAGERFEQVVELATQARAFIAEHCGDPLSHRRLRRVDP